MSMAVSPHLVAIFGGAVSGSEAAHQLTLRGIPCVVFEQNTLPYGKIEDGLPKWHVKLRDKEIQNINNKLSHPLVTYVPNTKLGSDITYAQLKEIGFSAVLLAIGAWKDRPLALDEVDRYLSRGLIYQNPFIYWFNHKHEPDYQGEAYEITDDMAIVGGGLASLDVAKVIMFELVEKALKERGEHTDLFALDRSIARVLDAKGLTLEDLGIKGCTLYYRRRIKDMPLSPMTPTNAEEELKAQAVREKILNNYQSKYLFRVAPNHVPVDKIVEDDRLTGLVFRKTELVDGRLIEVAGSDSPVRCSAVVSSIGSIPDLIEGIPAKGQTYQIEDELFCRIKDEDRIFALGNAVTGRGNIKESMDHGREIAQNIIEGYLPEAEGSAHEAVQARIAHAIGQLADEMRSHKLSAEELSVIQQKVKVHQDRAGYDGNYSDWVARHMPTRLETLLGVDH